MTGFISPTLAVGDVARPFEGYWTDPLPDDAAIDTASSAVVAELVRQSQLASGRPQINVTRYTAEPLVVPASQPLVPVVTAHDSAFQQICTTGIPIPPDFRPTDDSDAAITIWQPDYVHPAHPDWVGRYYELGNLKPNVDASGREHWSCYYGGRLYRVNGVDRRGHFVDWMGSSAYRPGVWTDPDSTYTEKGWGVQGSGVPYMPGVITAGDLSRGIVDHIALLETAFTSPATPWWPAFRSDGNQSGNPLRYGMRLRLRPGYPVPEGLHPICQAIIRGASRNGLLITDQTSSCLAMRVAPSAASYLGGVPSWQVLNGFPWADLQLLAVGSDSNPVPTS